jgi:hypothetical protein
MGELDGEFSIELLDGAEQMIDIGFLFIILDFGCFD